MSRFPGMVTRGLQRPVCGRCFKNPAVCICLDVRPVETSIRLLILQHRMERFRPSATARLVTLSVPGARLFVKDDPGDERALVEALNAPGPRPYLVFPDPAAPEVGELREQGAWSAGTPPAFLLLDGSWRQVRRMRGRKRYLSELPVVRLAPERESAYRIRRQAERGHLATVEAAALLLARAEGNPEKFQPLVELLELMVTRILALRGLDREGRPLKAAQRASDSIQRSSP